MLLPWQMSQAQAETISTNFSGNNPGVQPSDESLNGLGDFTTFGAENLDGDLLGGTDNVGEVIFFQRGAYYFSGNRAYGFAGTGRSDIVFTPGVVREVELQVRGSSSADTTGAASTTLVPNSPFGDSDLTVLIYSDQGLQLTLEDVSNTEFQSIGLDITNPNFNGDSITRISLINQGPDNSVADLGFLSVTTVPEPSSIAFLGLGGLAMLRRRRRA